LVAHEFERELIDSSSDCVNPASAVVEELGQLGTSVDPGNNDLGSDLVDGLVAIDRYPTAAGQIGHLAA